MEKHFSQSAFSMFGSMMSIFIPFHPTQKIPSVVHYSTGILNAVDLKSASNLLTSKARKVTITLFSQNHVKLNTHSKQSRGKKNSPTQTTECI